MRAFRILAAVPVALAFLGAGVAPLAGGVPFPVPGEEWVLVERSGGFAGIHVRWAVAADGAIRRIEGASGVEAVVRRAAAPERAALGALVAERPAPVTPAPATVSCSDCFTWTVTVFVGGDAPGAEEGEPRRRAWSARVGEFELSGAPELARIIGIVTGEGPGVPIPFR
jgi:hypothetical protein